MPDAIIIAGANGAGKTTFARQLLPTQYPDACFLNADEIRNEDARFTHPISAGKEMLRRLAVNVEAGNSFALETTLASQIYARRIPRWQADGYRVTLHFIEAPSADFAVERVAQRVASGGHDIPEADIRRRFHRGLKLFTDLYCPLVTAWYHWTTGPQGLHFVEQHPKP